MIIAPPYLTACFPHIFSVWKYVPHISYVCRMRGGPPDVGCDQNGYDRVDPSPRDHQISTCVKVTLSGRDRSAYLMPRGDTRSAGSSWKADTARSRSDRPLSSRSIGRSRRFVEELHDRGSIIPRSRCDRAAIVELSSWTHLH